MDLNIDFSKQMLLRVAIYEGTYCLASLYDKELFESSISWLTKTMTTLEKGSHIIIDNRIFEIIGFRVHVNKMNNPTDSLAGIDTDLVGNQYEHNMTLQINVQALT